MDQGTESAASEEVQSFYPDIVQLARAALVTGSHQATPMIRRLARRYRQAHPALATELVKLLREGPTRATAVSAPVSKPVDNESRLALVREESPVVLTVAPILRPEVRVALEQIVQEYTHPGRLFEAGLAPTRTTLFVGPPGVGKTLAARWLAHILDRPLIILDLASVMSSLLGRTGENVRRVLDYAKQTPCVLLLDELDAVAKRRDDITEIGELKRLVTVLLQEIDMWPEGSLLIAATNHAELLDPAVWRRFEVTLDFALPDETSLAVALKTYLDDDEVSESTIGLVAASYRGVSFSDLEREVMRARRTTAMSNIDLDGAILGIAKERFRRLPSHERVHLAASLLRSTGISQRKVHEITGVSRDTLRKHAVSDHDDTKDQGRA